MKITAESIDASSFFRCQGQQIYVCRSGIRKFFNLPADARKVWLVLSDRSTKDSCRVSYRAGDIHLDGESAKTAFEVDRMFLASFQVHPKHVHLSVYYD